MAAKASSSVIPNSQAEAVHLVTTAKPTVLTVAQKKKGPGHPKQNSATSSRAKNVAASGTKMRGPGRPKKVENTPKRTAADGIDVFYESI